MFTLGISLGCALGPIISSILVRNVDVKTLGFVFCLLKKNHVCKVASSCIAYAFAMLLFLLVWLKFKPTYPNNKDVVDEFLRSGAGAVKDCLVFTCASE